MPACSDDASLLAVVRDRLARAWLHAADVADPGTTIGSVTLRPYQVDAVRRLRVALDEVGGALLADEVGLGKTYVALALAKEHHRSIIVAPAALRQMWSEAQSRAGTSLPFVSVERLSRAGVPTLTNDRFDLVVVDEAHHARNPRTRRYSALARLTIGARVLLLSATPLHNRRRDLDALLALFLGERASALDDAALARCIVRRDRQAIGHGPSAPPAVSPMVTITLPEQDDLLDAILTLPPPLPPAEAGDGGALIARMLVRQWSSSIGALRAAVRRRIVRGSALEAALAIGRHPTASELRAWIADDAVQLGLELFDPEVAEPAPLLGVVGRHLSALRAMNVRLASCDDVARADAIRMVRQRHPGVPVVAFSHSAATVTSLYALLRRNGGVCALDARGARVAGGRMSREDALDRFAPRARGRPPPHAAERIDCLLTTDLLSEGVNLQDAGVVVHLDLPWTPARLEQRVGRAARPGSPHALVHVYALASARSAEALLRVEALLDRKRALARVTVGTGALSGDDSPARAESPVRSAESLRELLSAWLQCDAGVDGEEREPVVACVSVSSGPPAALAAVRQQERYVLLGIDLVSGAVCHDPVTLLALAERSMGTASNIDDVMLRRARLALRSWRARQAATAALGIHAPSTRALQRSLARRVAAVLASLPRHRRAAARADADSVRRLAGARLGAGATERLEVLLREATCDGAWLRRAALELAEVAPSATDADADSCAGERSLTALLLLKPEPRQ